MRAQTLSGARDQLFESKAVSIVAVILLSSAAYLFFLVINYIIVV